VYVNKDPSIIEYLGHPTIALSRTYQDRAGRYLTLSLLGNSGEDSSLLFSHTLETCLPGRLWKIVESHRESIPIDDRSMHVQYLLTEHPGPGQRQIALYWYLWDTPERDSRAGVLSMRVYPFVSPGESEDAVLARPGDLVRQLFPATIVWDRFWHATGASGQHVPACSPDKTPYLGEAVGHDILQSRMPDVREPDIR
jgi:hypothetical protein